MADPDAYITLASSLPASARLFVGKQPPLSRVRLERRLAMLSREDREMLARIERLLSWSAYTLSDTDQEVFDRARDVFADLESETLRAVVTERMDLRTVIAALRMRRRSDAVPTGPFGPSRLVPHITANWSERTFRLDQRLPWLREAVTLFEARDSLGLERYLLGVTFRQLQRHAARHQFDVEAVVIYVLKWNIFDRWSRSDPDAAARRFEAITRDVLADVGELVLEGSS